MPADPLRRQRHHRICRPGAAARSAWRARSRSPRCFLDFTALDNVALAVQAHAGHSFRFWRDARKDEGCASRPRRARRASGSRSAPTCWSPNLSHGEHRQLEIAMALATQAAMLLLDEPMAGMGVEESARMVRAAARARSGVTILLVEHDMEAVFALADRITVLVYGRVIASGAPERSGPMRKSARLSRRRACGDGPWLIRRRCSKSTASRPATAGARCCSACRWRSRRARWSRSWAATAWARPRPSARSWG